MKNNLKLKHGEDKLKIGVKYDHRKKKHRFDVSLKNKDGKKIFNLNEKDIRERFSHFDLGDLDIIKLKAEIEVQEGEPKIKEDELGVSQNSLSS